MRVAIRWTILPYAALAVLLFATLAATVLFRSVSIVPGGGTVAGPSNTPALGVQIQDARKIRRLCRDIEAGQFTIAPAKRRSDIRDCRRDGF